MAEYKTVNSKIESGRADFALSEVIRVKNTAGVDLKEYRSYCKKFPSMILVNGLAAALAFAYDKKETWEHIYYHCETWFIERGLFIRKNDKTMLTEYICGLETAQYRIVTKEALALFTWVSRFASGIIGRR